MARRKRKARIFDASGRDLGTLGAASEFDFFLDPGTNQDPAPFDPANVVWVQSIDPDVMKAEVPAGATMPTDITGLSRVRNYPQAGTDTWYAPTAGAIARGKINAAIETAQATGEKIANAGVFLADNFVPLLLGLAALYVLFQMERH